MLPDGDPAPLPAPQGLPGDPESQPLFAEPLVPQLRSPYAHAMWCHVWASQGTCERVVRTQATCVCVQFVFPSSTPSSPESVKLLFGELPSWQVFLV